MSNPEDPTLSTRKSTRSQTLGKIVRRAGGTLFAIFLIMQLVPYGRAHSNPPVTVQPTWDSAQTEALVRGACFDCHSNETRWPWYSHVAPVSWLVQRDVDEGRRELNFSVGHVEELEEAGEMVEAREMPPWFYKPTHFDAWLSEAEQRSLLAGLQTTFGTGEEGHDDTHRKRHEEEDDDD